MERRKISARQEIYKAEGLRFLTPLLELCSILYGMGVRLRLYAYRLGLFRRRSLPGFVVSVGNLTVGGTGKTPAVIMLARYALEQGHRVAVLSRGYRGSYKTRILEVSDGTEIKADPGEAGDEPCLLAGNLPGVPVVISRKRYFAGLFAHEKFGSDFFILDDGFQHLELNRDLDLALMDAGDPVGNGHLLPRGPLREPIDQLTRADACVITRSHGHTSDSNAADFLKTNFPGIPLFFADHLAGKVVFPCSNQSRDAGTLKGSRVAAFAAIAKPEMFRKTLLSLGVDLAFFRGFRDHHQFTREEILDLVEMKEKHGARYLLTTEKDWVRVAPLAPECPGLGYLGIRFGLLTGQDGLLEMIRNGSHI